MRGRILILVSLFAIVFFLNFITTTVFNYTRQISYRKDLLKREKNINTELLVELDDLLRSGKHIASLVRVELSNFIPEKQAGKIIFALSPSKQEKKTYCIISVVQKSRSQECANSP